MPKETQPKTFVEIAETQVGPIRFSLEIKKDDSGEEVVTGYAQNKYNTPLVVCGFPVVFSFSLKSDHSSDDGWEIIVDHVSRSDVGREQDDDGTLGQRQLLEACIVIELLRIAQDQNTMLRIRLDSLRYRNYLHSITVESAAYHFAELMRTKGRMEAEIKRLETAVGE